MLLKILKSKFEKFLFGLGIRFVGAKTSRDLENHFKSLNAIKNASLEDLLAVSDIGEVTAESIYTFLGKIGF